NTLKPSVGTLRVKARPVASDQRLEASLALAGVTQAAKRRPRVRTPCYGASKDLSWEPLLFTYQGPRCGTVLVWCPQSCRRRLNRANGHLGSPRNLGDPVVSSVTSRPELPGYPLQASAAHSSTGERQERVNARGTAKRRQRSAAGRATGSRSALIVPSKQGNSPRRTLRREAKRRPADPIEGNMWSPSRLRCMSP